MEKNFYDNEMFDLKDGQIVFCINKEEYRLLKQIISKVDIIRNERFDFDLAYMYEEIIFSESDKINFVGLKKYFNL